MAEANSPPKPQVLPLLPLLVHKLGYSFGYRIVRMTVGWVSAGLSPFFRQGQRIWPKPSEPPAWDLAIWAHCASLGEAAGMLRLLQGLDLPMSLVLTAQTSAGLSRLKKEAPAYIASPYQVTVAPFESPHAVNRFITAYRISALVIYESEWWPAYLEVAKRRQIPAFWLAAQCTSKTLRRWSYARVTARYLLGHFDFIQARSKESARRLRRLTNQKISLGFDAKGLGFAMQTSQPALNPDHIALERKPAFALYCLHADEWPWLEPEMPFLLQTGPTIVLPRKPRDFAFFRKVLKPLGFTCVSEQGAPENSTPPRSCPIASHHLLVDTLGQTARFLSQCDAALVGGSLNKRGGHAFFEPLSHGLRLYAGPHLHQQEPMARALRKAGLLTLWRPGENLSSSFYQSDLSGHRERIRKFFEEQQKDWGSSLLEARQALLSLLPQR